ncbi:hypothetical protein [Pseudoprimorskyibacter insulae]|uniref:Arginine transporter n=1 Tax=Pseudoprimorskyibacter insulae TaxID=1695997 RepID=A0A2R8AVC0_9RHOB|nr:hypothetical protein [Pseudoprimorskyibacter insulae]SPF79973.1 hypothetical protein PRI8871_01775 [Pseudoprimorskyibacter insulae]
MRLITIFIMVALVASCGGGKRRAPQPTGQVTRFSSGPISQACMASDRKARNPQLCGCIQTVANMSLSPSDQRRATKFFADPHQAQVVRQSDSSINEAFWRRYVEFADRAESGCQGY